MREEELEKRLQSAFPNITPPDEALHTRIQSLYKSKSSKKHLRVLWKPILGGAILAGTSAVILSRQPVSYVLEKMSQTTAPRTTYVDVLDYDSDGGDLRRIYWLAGEKQRVVTYAPAKYYGKPMVFIKIKQGKDVASWIPGQDHGNLHPYRAPSTGGEGENLTSKNVAQLTWRGPWIVRLPDRIDRGRCQWILQQDRTYESPHPMVRDAVTRSRTIWAIDAQTNRVSWKEFWTGYQSSPWRLSQRTDYRYDQSMPDSLFEVPANMALTPVLYPRATVPEPTFKPYFPKSDPPPGTFIVDWWRAALSR